MFPMEFGCVAKEIEDIQKCLGVYPANGKFGPELSKKINGANVIERNYYDKLMNDCVGKDTTGYNRYGITESSTKNNRNIITSPNLSQPINENEFVDQLGRTYKTVKIGTHTWMAENLRTNRYSNGESIDYDTKVSSYVNKPIFVTLNNGQYLYSWEAVIDQRGIAPNGWHVPTPAEWEELIIHCKNGSDDLKSTSGFPTVESGDYYERINCPNCKNWNNEYRSKVACHVCQDTRVINGKYIPKSFKSMNGNNRLKFNVKHLGILHEGEYNDDDKFWTSVLDTNPQDCGSICGESYIFYVYSQYIPYFGVLNQKHHEYMLPIRLVKD